MANARRLLVLMTAASVASVWSDTAGATGRSFVEDFARLSPKRWTISDGWTNGDHQDCTWSARNVTVAEGHAALVLDDRANPGRSFSCAEIQSTEFYGYGTYEVRMRSVAAPGTVTAFFTYTGEGFSPDLPHDEIDFEFLGKDPQSVQVNFFASGDGSHGHDVKLADDASKSVNDYAFEWLPNSIRWFVNGKLVHEVARRPDAPFPASPGRIILSLWNGTGPDMEGWLERFENPGNPLKAVYERVSFTAAGEPCQFPQSVVCNKHPAGSARRQ